MATKEELKVMFATDAEPTGADFAELIDEQISPSELTAYAKKVELPTTAQKAAWDAKETPTAAQTKATKALADAKAYTDTKTTGLVTKAQHDAIIARLVELETATE